MIFNALRQFYRHRQEAFAILTSALDSSDDFLEVFWGRYGGLVAILLLGVRDGIEPLTGRLHLCTHSVDLMGWLEFAPDHFVDDADVGLYDFHDFGADVFVNVVGDGESVMSVAAECYGGVNGLEE